MKNSIQYIIVTLLGFNLVVTLWIGSKISSLQTTFSQENLTQHPLPEHISKSKIVELSDKFIEAYNSKDMDACWNLFGEYAQAQITKDEVVSAVEKLDKVVGPVVSAKYLYFEPAGNQGNLNFYTFYYTTELTEISTLSDRGELQITVADDGRVFEMIKFYLTATSE
ncbi:MAG: hypothetical protein KJN98_06440 [Pontiella sp.]|nr:hypothetical protein [Pontiella sp.]